jgi:hypothetical protein
MTKPLATRIAVLMAVSKIGRLGGPGREEYGEDGAEEDHLSGQEQHDAPPTVVAHTLRVVGQGVGPLGEGDVVLPDPTDETNEDQQRADAEHRVVGDDANGEDGHREAEEEGPGAQVVMLRMATRVRVRTGSRMVWGLQIRHFGSTPCGAERSS